jgi:outer membrane protein assembly factor BamB
MGPAMVIKTTAAVLCFLSFACALIKPHTAPPLKGNPFPVEEAGSLNLPGRALFSLAGPENRIFLVLDGGDLLCLDVAGKSILWTYRSESPVSLAPALGEKSVYLCDQENVLHSVGFDGTLIFRRPLGREITSPPAESAGTIYLGTGDGSFLALDSRRNGETLWTFSASGAVRSAPAFSGDRIFFGDESGTVSCLDKSGGLVWSYKAQGKVQVSPAASGKRLVFGTEDFRFYCLDTARGRKKWSFALDGGPVRPPLIPGKRIVFAASNSVIYCLSRRRGEILWWKALPSRILYRPLVLGEAVLVSSASSEVAALELESGRDKGGTDVLGEISTGILWVPPFLVVIARNPDRAADRAVFLKSIPTTGKGAF